MPERNLVSWTSMQSAMTHINDHDKGLHFLLEMMRSGFLRNKFSLATVISAYATLKAVKLGRSIHSIALQTEIETDSSVGSSIMYMYANCGDIDAMERVFERVGDRNLACWNAMVEAYALNGYGYEVMRCASLMHRRGLIPDHFTCSSALKGCSGGGLCFGRHIHALVIHFEVEFNTAVMNSLADMYFTTGVKECVVEVFRRIQRKDDVLWNTMISGYAHEEDNSMAMAFFSEMLSTASRPNKVTSSVMFRLYSATEDILLGLQLCSFTCHLWFFSDELVGNSLINMLSRCGEVEKASLLFSSLTTRSIITWNEMVTGYNLKGYDFEVLLHFSRMLESGVKVDEFTYSNILGACHGI